MTRANGRWLMAGGLSVVFAASVAAAAVGCGGGDTKVNYPQSDAGGAAVTNQQGGQVGVSGGATPTGEPGESSGLTGSALSSYQKGWQAWLAGDLKTAKAAFQETIDKEPKSPAAHYSLGTVLERLGDNAGAQQEFRTAFTVKEYEPAECAYALNLARGGHTGEADTFLTSKKNSNPKSARIMTCLAEVKSLANDSASAQQLAQDALRIDPDYKEAMVTIARDHYRARRLDLATYALKAILDGFGESSPARDKNNAEAHLLRGLIEREQGNRQAAITDFEAAQKSRPDMVEALIQVGAMKLEAGNASDALPILESATRYAPNSALAHLNLGDAYRLSGRPADAKRELDQALSLDSSLAQAHYDLGLMYLFSTNIPGTNADSQVATAIKELQTYKSMRGAKAAPAGPNKDSAGDDVDELISRAIQKQNELKMGTAAAAGSAKAGAGGAPPAAGGKDAGAAAAAAAPASSAKKK